MCIYATADVELFSCKCVAISESFNASAFCSLTSQTPFQSSSARALATTPCTIQNCYCLAAYTALPWDQISSRWSSCASSLSMQTLVQATKRSRSCLRAGTIAASAVSPEFVAFAAPAAAAATAVERVASESTSSKDSP